MKLYNVTDYDEVNEWHPTKAVAIKVARDLSKDLPDYETGVVVNEHDIGATLNREVACRLLSGSGFSLKQTEVWASKKGRKP